VNIVILDCILCSYLNHGKCDEKSRKSLIKMQVLCANIIWFKPEASINSMYKDASTFETCIWEQQPNYHKLLWELYQWIDFFVSCFDMVCNLKSWDKPFQAPACVSNFWFVRKSNKFFAIWYGWHLWDMFSSKASPVAMVVYRIISGWVDDG